MTTTNGTVLSVRYGNEKLWAVMTNGSPYNVTLNNYIYPRYHQTLAVFPFTAPYNLTSPPAAVVATPWDLTCYGSENWAAFGGKIYYSCIVSTFTSSYRKELSMGGFPRADVVQQEH